jgi:hypothetical protein
MDTESPLLPPIYNAVAIRVELDSFTLVLEPIKALAQQISTACTDIINKVGDLKLGFAGATADEVQSFFDAWGLALRQLFGNGDPNASEDESGTFNILIGALYAVGSNYDQTEDFLASNFGGFAGALRATNPQGNPTPLTANNSAVGETTS